MLGQINFTPYSRPYVGSPTGELNQAIASRLDIYNRAVEADDILSQKVDEFQSQISPFTNDKVLAMSLMDEARQEITQRVTKGDYENAVRGIKATARNFAAKAQPLLQNKQLYEGYVKSLQDRLKEGKISQTTYNDAIAKSVSGYQGLNLDNPSDTDSLFRGFSPSDDVELGKELSDYYKGWKSDGGSREIIDEKTGLIKKITWEEAAKGVSIGGKYYSGQDIMKMAGQRYLMSNPKVKDYYNTQAQLRPGRFESELDNALQSTTEAAYFNNIKQSQDFLPEYVFERLGLEEYLNNPSSGVGPVTKNIFNKDVLEGMKITPDGNLRMTTQFYELNSGGGYNKYVGADGRVLPVEEGKKLHNDYLRYGTGERVVKQGISENELKKIEKQTSSVLNDMLLSDLTTSPQGRKLLGSMYSNYTDLTPAQQLSYASDMLAKGMIPSTYKNEFLGRYKNSVKNNQQVGTSQWLKQNVTDFKMFGDMAMTPSGAIATLSNRPVAIANKDEELNDIVQQGFQKDGGATDFNSILKAIGDEGWAVKSVIENGVLKGNPLMDAPGTTMTMNIEHPDKGTRQVNLIVGLTEADQTPVLNTLQQVSKLAYSTTGGKINVGNNVQLYVRNVPTGNPEGQAQFYTTVTEIKSDGNIGNIWTLDEFQDTMLMEAGKGEARRFLGSKNTK